MARGDHIYYVDYFTVIPYKHHGIDCGDQTVIHYTGEGIFRVSIHEFSQGKQIQQCLYDYCDSPDIVIQRAESRLGERNYHLIFNNCEHFANWCKTGIGESEQVKPILGVLDDFLNWRMEDKERQNYKRLIENQEKRIRKLILQLQTNEKLYKSSKETDVILNKSNGQQESKGQGVGDKGENRDGSSTPPRSSALEGPPLHSRGEELAPPAPCSLPPCLFGKQELNSTSSLESFLITDQFDYRILQALLQEGCWQEADELTLYAMLKISNREYYRYFRPIDIANFPREHLLIIDKLWREYSRNLFGFTVQKEIYQSLGGTQNYHYEIWENFSDHVGWRVNELPLPYEKLCFSINAPKGHLPHGKRIGSEIIGFLAIV